MKPPVCLCRTIISFFEERSGIGAIRHAQFVARCRYPEMEIATREATGLSVRESKELPGFNFDDIRTKFMTTKRGEHTQIQFLAMLSIDFPLIDGSISRRYGFPGR